MTWSEKKDLFVEEMVEHLTKEISNPGEASSEEKLFIHVAPEHVEEFLRGWAEWWGLSKDERRQRIDEMGEEWLSSTP